MHVYDNADNLLIKTPSVYSEHSKTKPPGALPSEYFNRSSLCRNIKSMEVIDLLRPTVRKSMSINL